MIMSIARRTFLKATFAASSTVALGTLPIAAMADWPKAAFEAKTVGDALKVLYSSLDVTNSPDIKLEAPDVAENGAVVPVTISTQLADVETITIIAEKNAVPLVGQFKLTKDSVAYVSTRIKMAETSHVVAVVKAGGKLYSTKKSVTVTAGGCGG
jgi:sulfur-oxidizing protein SoxY